MAAMALCCCAARETMCYGALDLYDADVLREYVSELRSLARAGGNRSLPLCCPCCLEFFFSKVGCPGGVPPILSNP